MASPGLHFSTNPKKNQIPPKVSTWGQFLILKRFKQVSERLEPTLGAIWTPPGSTVFDGLGP